MTNYKSSKNSRLANMWLAGPILFFLVFSAPSFGATVIINEVTSTLEITFTSSGHTASGINILGFGHQMTAPYDPATGARTGRHQHMPFRIVKAFDQISPLIYNALANNEEMNIVIRTFRRGRAGLNIPVSSISLQNARVIDIRKPSSEDISAGNNGLAEEISFVYTTITWTDEASGTSTDDHWNLSDNPS